MNYYRKVIHNMYVKKAVMRYCYINALQPDFIIDTALYISTSTILSSINSGR